MWATACLRVCTQPNVGSDGLMFLYAHMYSCSIHKVNPIASQYPAGKQMFKKVD